MDPIARRFMWEIISDLSTKRQKCTIILSTQSMEECDALCTRIGILVAGRFRCIGSGQRLRDRFGLGYQVEVSFHVPDLEHDEMAKRKQAELISFCGPGHESLNETFEDDSIRFSEGMITNVFKAMNRDHWSQRLTKLNSGSELILAIETNGSVGLRHLASWCILEEKYDNYLNFLDNNLPGYVLRERKMTRVRAEIPFRSPNGSLRRLSMIFGLFESKKTEIGVKEYSVAQTSLEQIFNGFAAKQDTD